MRPAAYPIVATLLATPAVAQDRPLTVDMTEDPWDDEGPIDVVVAGREYVGTLSAGEPGMPEAFGPDGLVVHLERDELDVPTLLVSRVVVEG